jgi:DegV family protein with EDD domain
MKKPIGILIDSSCTYEENYIKDHEIEIIPLTFSDAQNTVYEDNNQAISNEELLARLDKGELFKTAASNIGKLMNKVEDMLTRFEQVIFLPISMGLSSQYAQSLIVQQEFPGKFFPIKSVSGAMASEFVLYRIVELLNENRTAEEIVSGAENLYKYIVTYFSCEDLSGLRQGGRATKAVIKAIDIFKLKPIIHLDVKNHFGGVGKNYMTIMKKINNAIHENFNRLLTPDKIKNIGIYYSGYEEEKKQAIIKMIVDFFKIQKEKIIVR